MGLRTWLGLKRKRRLPSGYAVISFPKSGRTWFRVMLAELDLKVRFDHAGSDLKSATHWEELTTAAADKYEKFVVLVRDPRDAVLSGFYHATNRSNPPYQGSLEQYLRDPRRGIEKAARFNIMWRNLAAERGMPCISYEATHADPAQQLKRVSQWFGHQASPEHIQAVADRNAFEAMRQREIEGAYRDKFSASLGVKDPNNMNSLKVRKGKIGSFKDEFNDEDLVFSNNVLRRIGYFNIIQYNYV